MLWNTLKILLVAGIITICPAMENQIMGVPEIECGENAVTFTVKTKSAFRGDIYIRGKHNVPQCKQEYRNNDYNGAVLSIPIGDCGMTRVRQLEPNGMNYVLVFVANFRPPFETKLDRAFNVRCFYAHTDNTVGSQLEVGVLSTETLEKAVMMKPHCQYSVRKETVDGPIAREAHVGDLLVHRFECDNSNYGMLVRDCVVTDGAGDSHPVVDKRGCPVGSPQSEFTYNNELNQAFVTFEAYRFPDRGTLQFQCQIGICNKREEECVGFTPPNCPGISTSEFIPNSRVNSKLNPTQVVATFEESTTPPTTRKPSFIPQAGKNQFVNQPFPTFARRSDDPSVEVTRQFAPYAPNMLQSERMAALQNYNSPYFRKKDPPLPPDHRNDTDSDAIVHYDNDIHQEKAWRDQPVVLKRPNRSTRPMPNSSPTSPTILQSDEPPNFRKRRTERETLDVIAEPIFIKEIGDTDPIDNTLTNYPEISTDNIWGKEHFCTDRYGIYTLSAVFGLLALLALPSAIYTFYDIVFLRSKRKKGLISTSEQLRNLSLHNNNFQNRIRPLNTEMAQSMSCEIPRITPRQILNR